MDITIVKKKVVAKSRKLKEPKKVESTEDKHSDKYYTTHLETFEPFNCRSWKSINVLAFLNGKPWDDLALGYVHALRPSSIRVTEGIIKLDARVWRVTVYIDKDNIIETIEQEVEVGLPENVANGEALGIALKYGIDSPQCQWYNEVDGGFIMSAGGYFKQWKGEWIKFPEIENEVDPFDEAGELIKNETSA